MKDHMVNRVNAWIIKSLSNTVKKVSLKVATQVIPTYVMSYFKIPENFVQS